MSLKHHGERSPSINWSDGGDLILDLDKVEPWRGMAFSAITLGHWFHERWVNIESGGVWQGVDLPKGPWQISVRSCGHSSLAMERWLLVKCLLFITLCAAGSSWWANGGWKCSICSSECGSEMSCAPFKTKQLCFSFQFYIIVVLNWNFDIGSMEIHVLVSTNRVSEWKLAKFHCCPSTSWPVNHSIFKTEAFGKISL